MLFLALRHLTSRKKQTILTLLGIVLGTAGYIAISGLMLGFQEFIVDQLVNNDAHVRISSREEYVLEHSLDDVFFSENEVPNWLFPPSGRRDNAFLSHPQGWFDRLDRDPEVFAYSPQLSIQILVSRGRLSLSARLTGSDAARQARVTNIESYMVEGQFKDIGETGNRVVVGDALLQKLGARVGETVWVASAATATVAGGAAVPVKVVGSFHLGIKALDESMLFGSLTDVQKINRTPSRLSDIAVRLVDVSQAAALASRWSALSEDKVLSWDQANEGILSVFKTQDVVRYSMTAAILVVAAFGIYNILNMAVTQKRHEIAILRSMGFESRDVLSLFFTQGLILGVIGGLIGCGIGYFACLYLGSIEVSSARGLGGSRMMISYDAAIYWRGLMLAFFSATLASLLPARAAAKMLPIEIIRSEGT